MNSRLPVVIIDLRTWSWTGIGRVTQGVYSCALELEADFEIWYIVSKNSPIYKTRSNTICFYSDPFGLMEQLEFQRMFKKFKGRHAILHSLYFNVPLYVPNHISLITNFYDVLTGTDEFRTIFHKIAYKIYIWGLKKHRAVILAQSDFTAKQIERFHPLWRVIICPPGYKNYLQMEEIDVKERYGLHRPYFLYVGLNKPRKNLSGLVRAYKTALESNQNINFDLVICGPVFDKSSMGFDIKAFIDGEPLLGDRLHLLGFIPDEHLYSLYKNASLYIVPSHLESGYSYPALEALSAGTPVLLNEFDMYNFATSSNAVMFFDGSLSNGARSLEWVIRELLIKSLFDSVDSDKCDVLSRFSWDEVKKVMRHLYQTE